jgi:hypothetical protein
LVADVESPRQIVEILLRLVGAWSTGTMRTLVPDRAACEAYSAERQTEALVRALEGTPPAEPFVPGSVGIPPSLRNDIGDAGFVTGLKQAIRP